MIGLYLIVGAAVALLIGACVVVAAHNGQVKK